MLKLISLALMLTGSGCGFIISYYLLETVAPQLIPLWSVQLVVFTCFVLLQLYRDYNGNKADIGNYHSR